MNARELDLYENTIVSASKLPETFTSPDDDWVPILFLLNSAQLDQILALQGRD